jgi:hypothetical protein
MDRLAVDDPLRDPRVIPKLFPWEDYDDDDTEDENQPPSEEVIREMQKVNRILRREGEEGLERYLLETNARDAAAKSSEQAVYDPHELRPRHWMDSGSPSRVFFFFHLHSFAVLLKPLRNTNRRQINFSP